MQRLCFLLCGLLVSCLCSWGSDVPLKVNQTPSLVTVTHGEPIQISCCWNLSEIPQSSKVKVKWYKNNKQMNYSRENIENCSILTVNGTQNDPSGFYVCEVTKDIPRLTQVKGPGTNVTYKAEPDNSTDRSSNLTVSWGVTGPGPVLGAVISGAVLVICICASVWRVRKNWLAPERIVIREEEHNNSEEDQQSSDTSRGSTEWQMVSVYESYFDLQRSDEDKNTEQNDTSCKTDTGSKKQQRSNTKSKN